MKLTRKLIALNLALLLSFSLLPIQVLAAAIDLSLNQPVSFETRNEDGYTFTPTSTGIYTITFSGEVNSASGGSLAVYQSGTYISGDEDTRQNWSVCSFTSLMESGKTYTIVPEGGVGTGSYTVSVNRQDLSDLTAGTAVRFSVTNEAGDNDRYYAPHYFSFTPSRSGLYTLDLDSSDQTGYAGSIGIRDSAFNELDRTGIYIGDGINTYFEGGQTYYLVFDPSDMAGTYSIMASQSSFPALTVGAASQFSVASADSDRHYAPHHFSFAPSQSGWYTFDLSSSDHTGYAGDIYFRDSAFGELEYNAAYIGNGVSSYFEGGQTYYVSFEPSDYSDAAGTYSIMASQSSFPEVTTSDSQSVVTNGPLAYATFTPETSGSYEITAVPADNSLSEMNIYSRTKVWLGGAWRGYSQPTVSKTMELTEGTIYYIGVNGSGTISVKLAGSDQSGYCGKITDQYPQGENLTWELSSDGTLTISGTGEMADYNFRESPWYESRDKIKTAKIGDGATSIGCFAFSECMGLTSVTIPDSVSSIAVGALQVCTGLTSVTIPDGVTYIEDSAFASCTGLTSVKIPSSVASIGRWAFTNCDALADVYYSGTEAQWNAVTIENDNDPLLNATLHFLGEDEYTYEIISPLGTMDEEIGYYTVDYYREKTIVIDAPVDELAGVYIDDVKLVPYSETIEDYDDFYAVNTSTAEAPTSISVGGSRCDSLGLHTLAVEFNTADGGVALRRVTQNFATLPFEFTVLPDGYVGMEYTYELEDSWPNYWLFIPDDDELVRIPDGLTFGETTGQITGTPTKAGTWYFTIQGHASIAGGAPIDYKITIKSPETVLPEAVKFVPYSYSFGEAAEVTAGRLPRGLSLDAATGELTGAPLESGSFEFTVHKANGSVVYQMTVANNTNTAVQRPNDYEIIENVGTQDPRDPNSFYMDEYREETFAIAGPYAEFYRLLIDGVEKVRDVDYTVREGSTIITIRTQTFRDVGEGTHTIAAEFRSTDSNGKTSIKQVAQNYTLNIRRPSDNTGSSSSSSNSSSGSTNYSIKVPKVPNCTIKVSPTGASEGTRVTLTVRPNTGYVLSELAVTGPKGQQVPLTQAGDYQYTFRMPNGKVDISVAVEKTAPAGETPFVDMKETDWFYQDVAAVYQKGWMVGTSKDTFGPGEQILRGMMVSVLHRMAGEPAAESTYFADVPLNQYYTSAAAWAVEQGIVSGYGDGRFGPSDPMTREQIIMILYNYANLNKVDTSAQSDLSQFHDLDQMSPDAQRAMSWACSIGLIKGKGDGILDPAGATTRAETAAFLIRFTTLTEN